MRGIDNDVLGLMYLSIVGVVLIESVVMNYLLNIFPKKYFRILLICGINSFWAVFVYSGLNKKFKCLDNIIIDYAAGLSWILYTQSYLYFLASYYKNLLQKWQTRLCYTMNFINFIAQVHWNIFYLFNTKVNNNTRMILILTAENISATLTILSEGFLSGCILLYIIKLAFKPIPKDLQLMIVKVVVIVVVMFSLDFIVIFLEYSGRETKAYFTKPLLLTFKFLVELLILGHCKIALMVLSGMDNW